LWMWDRYSLTAKLLGIGFVSVRKCEFGDCEDPQFLKVEDEGRYHDKLENIAECALEARKPRAVAFSDASNSENTSVTVD